MSLNDSALRFIKPDRLAECEIASHRDIRGIKYYIIHNSETESYIRLNSHFYRLYIGMDGHTRLPQIVKDAFADGSIPDEKILIQFIFLLLKSKIISLGKDDNSLQIQPFCHDSTPQIMSKKTRLFRAIFNARLTYNNADQIITSMYNLGGKLVFRKTTLITAALLIVVSVPTLLLFTAFHHPIPFFDAELAPPHTGSIPIIIGIILLSLFLHEAAHALTCKHFGRKVSHLGVMVYFGFPAFFTDTTDACMLSKSKRIAIDIVGLLTNLIIAWISIVLAIILKLPPIFPLKFLIAFNLFIAIYNLIPFLKYDGYFIITDFLEMPNLREDSIRVVFNTSKWINILRTRPINMLDGFILVYGILSLSFGLLILTISILALFSIARHFWPAFLVIIVLALICAFLFYRRRRRCRDP